MTIFVYRKNRTHHSVSSKVPNGCLLYTDACRGCIQGCMDTQLLICVGRNSKGWVCPGKATPCVVIEHNYEISASCTSLAEGHAHAKSKAFLVADCREVVSLNYFSM